MYIKKSKIMSQKLQFKESENCDASLAYKQ